MKNHPRSYTRLSDSNFRDLLKILLILSLMPLAILFYSLRVKDQIATQAEQIADGEPYCILVPKGDSGYRPAKNFTDTMGLLMRGSNAQNHAVLVVGYQEHPKTYHWSYFNFGFEEGALTTGRRDDCIGHKFDYNNLSLGDYSETVAIMVNSTTYHIPLVYQPYTLHNGLGFVTQIPSFRPAKATYGNMLHVYKHRGRPMRLLEEDPGETKTFVSLVEYGLETSPYQSARAGADSDTPYGTYYAKNDEGDLATIISCPGPEDIDCQVRFNEGEWTYSFKLMPTELHQWRSIERQVVEFVDSFAGLPASVRSN